MGLWDRQVEHLWSLGIRLNPLERSWLENPPEGAQVLHLHPLWDPETPDGLIHYMEDAEGEVIWKAEIIDLVSPHETNRTDWGAKAVTRTLAQEMEHQFGSLSQPYPCYFGQVTGDTDDYECNVEYMRREETHPYPFWTCLPLSSAIEIEAAKQVRLAGTNQIRNSIYDDLFFVCEVEARSEWCISAAEVWLEVNDSNWKPPPEDPRWGSADLAWEEWDDPEAMKESVAEAYGRLIEAGYTFDPRYSREQHVSMGTEFVPFHVEPIDTFLAGGDTASVMGLDMWRSIRSRTEALRWRICTIVGAQQKHVLEVLEGALQ